MEDFFWLPDARQRFGLFNNIPFHCIVSHDEALPIALYNNVNSATWIHFDYHHDWYISPEQLDSLSLGSLDGVISCGNYAGIAAKAGLIKTFIWVYPDHHQDISIIHVPRSLALCEIEVISVPYSLFIEEFFDKIDQNNISLAIACLSPDFVPERDIGEFFNKFRADKEFEYRALDCAYERVVSGRSEPNNNYFRLNLSHRVVSYFHGSKISSIRSLDFVAGTVHASPSSVFAACYGLNPYTKLGWFQGIDYISDRQEVVFLIAPDARELPENAPCSMYVIRGHDGQLKGRGGCENHDFIIEAPVAVLEEIAVADVRDYLRRHGAVLPDRRMRLDMSRLPIKEAVAQEFCHWMGMSWEALLLLRSTPFHLMIFTHLRAEDAWQPFFPLVYWHRLAARCLYPRVPASVCSSEDDGYHGLSHGLETALIAVLFSSAQGVPAAPVFLAALSHDLRPAGDQRGSVDAGQSARVLEALLTDAWRDFSGNHDQRMIEAVRSHSARSRVKDRIAMILRDADRVRLSWERGYAPRFFATEIGKEIARNGANYLGELKARLMFSDNVKMEITPAANGHNLTIWHLGRRYELESDISLSREYLNYIAAVYNISDITVIGALTPNDDLFSSVLPVDLPVFYVYDLSRGAFSAPPDLRGPIETYLWTMTATALPNPDALMLLRSLPVGNIAHIEVSQENLGWVCDNLIELASMDVTLVYCRDPLKSDGEELRQIASAVLRRKRCNADLSSVRLITPYSWCWLQRPEDAPVVLAAARNCYSPLTSRHGPRFDRNVFDRTLEDVRLRRIRCKDCAFAVNCVSAEFASLDDDSAPMPRNSLSFRTWFPYAPR